MAQLASLHATVYGRVQGVYFRAFVQQRALGLGLQGDVRNLPDGEAVEVNAEGEITQLQKLLEYLETGPPSARVDRVETSWADSTGRYSGFHIRYH